jgi:hypothetical protein
MEQSNLLGRFESYEENGVLRIWYQDEQSPLSDLVLDPALLFHVQNPGIKHLTFNLGIL